MPPSRSAAATSPSPRLAPSSRALVGAIEAHLHEPSAKGLAAAVTRAIRDGAAAPGDRLPPIRALAHELAVSPTTVSAAWALLTRAGALRTEGRRGTVVADTSAPRAGRYHRALERQETFALDLSSGIPDAALLPSLDRAVRTLTPTGGPRSYLDDPVLPELAEVLTASWPYAPPALTVVDGAMDGLELVIRLLVRYGDRVVVEHPTFPPLLDLLEAAGAELVGVPLDVHGPRPDAMRAALAEPARVVVLQPRGHNPTGVSTTPARAAELAALVAGTDTVVLEDDSASAISSASEVSLGAHLPEQTVHVRSYSKSHGPDLRLAAMSGPRELLAEVAHLRQLGQGWSSRLLQRVLLALLTDAHSREEVEQARDEYAHRRRQFVDALAAHGVQVGGDDGLNVWVPVHDETAAVMRLAARGIGVAPGSPFAVLPDEDGHVRVTVGLLTGTPAEIAAVADEVATAARTAGWGARAR